MPQLYTLTPAQIEALLSPPSKQANADPTTLAILPFADLAMGGWTTPPTDPLPSGWKQALINAMVLWWKRSRGSETPTYQTIRPYGDAARAMLTEIVGYLPEKDIPWGVIDLVNTGAYPEVLAAPIKWTTIEQVIQELPASVRARVLVEPSPWYQTATSRDYWKALDKQFRWEETPWKAIPWAGIPWPYLKPTRTQAAIQRGAGIDETTDAFVDDLLDAYEALAVASGESATDIDLPPDWGKDDVPEGGDQTAPATTTTTSPKKRSGWGTALAVVGAIGLAFAGGLAARQAIKNQRSKR